MDVRIMLKSESGEYQPKYVTKTSLVDWFKSHVDTEGNVTEDIIIYQQCDVDRSGEKMALVMSDYSVDRDMERIDPAGWDLTNYKKNPIILWGHDSSRPSIGHMESIRKRKGDDGALIGVPSFSPKDVDEFAWSVGEKLNRGDLNAGSVGFRSTKVEIVDDDKEPARLIHCKQELYEFSIVNVPSNVNATVVRLDAEPDALKVADELEETMEEIKDKTYLDSLFEERADETSPQADHEVSDLAYLFRESDTRMPIEELFYGKTKNRNPRRA